MKKSIKSKITENFSSEDERVFWNNIMMGLLNCYQVSKSLSKDNNTHENIIRAYMDEVIIYEEEKKNVAESYVKKYHEIYSSLLDALIKESEQEELFEECAVYKKLKEHIKL